MNTIDVALSGLDGERDRENTFSAPDSGQIGEMPRLRAAGDDKFTGGHGPDVAVVHVDVRLADPAILKQIHLQLNLLALVVEFIFFGC